MSVLWANRSAAHADSQAKRTPGAYAWFALMLGGWVTFFTVVAFSAGSLAPFYERLRGLPLAFELLVWLLIFPFTLALTVWESSWDEPVRSLVVVFIAVAWSAMFFPRKRSGSAGSTAT